MSAPAGFIIEELFQFDKQWYGVLRSEDHKHFKRYVKITRIYKGGCDWTTINETLENAVKYFYESDQKNESN